MTAHDDAALPDGLLVGWYGDDFTGSAAVMEALTFAGLPSVLFLQTPTTAQRERFRSARGIGIASTARARGPDWMRTHLPPAFDWLKATGAALCHYKTCSTLDSSPRTGSIGLAIELAQACFRGRWVPFFVAAPDIRRYQAFGNLFAAAGPHVFRLDRHPVMSRHPVTPMNEADVCRHLADQTTMPMALVNLEDLARADGAQARIDQALRDWGDQPGLAVMDTLNDADLARVGEHLWRHRARAPFVAGSQGIEYALIAYWRSRGWVPPQPVAPRVRPVDRIVVVSGSVSPTTQQQIACAQAAGFDLIPFDATAVLAPHTETAAVEAAIAGALDCLAAGRSPIVASAQGPDDPAVGVFQQAVSQSSFDTEAANQAVGDALGRILDAVMRRSGVRRGVVAGGDTSGHVMRQMQAYALSAVAQTTPGAALVSLHSEGPHNGIELALKGGQMGSPDIFACTRAGGVATLAD